MLNVLYVGIGGFFGSVSRYLVSGWMQKLISPALFPAGTWTVNIVGSFLLAYLAVLTESRSFLSPEGRLLLFIGFFGGFTTFSTFSVETLNLLRGDQWFLALINAGGQVLAGILAAIAGYFLAKMN